MTLAGTHRFLGSALIEEGELILDDAELTGLVNVAERATLSGKGSIAGDLSVQGTIRIDLDADHRIDVTGGIEAVLAELQISGDLTAPSYVLINHGGLVNEFTSVTGVPGGYVVDQSFGGTSIALVSEADPFTNWAEITSGLAGADAEWSADPNKDGVANGIAFFLGAENANIDAYQFLPEVEAGGDSLTFRFPRNDLAAGHPFHVRYTTDLIVWPALVDGQAGFQVLIEDDALGVGLDQITTTVPLGLAIGGRLFLDLLVEQ